MGGGTVSFHSCIYSLGVGWLALLILDLGAMRRPDYRDKRGGNNSHAFFVSITYTHQFNNIFTEQGVFRAAIYDEAMP